jgi:hypothetical protein
LNSSGSTPQSSFSNASVCSPRSGGRLTSAIDTTFDEQIYTKERCDADPFAAMGAILVLMRGHNESKTKSKRSKDARNADRRNAREHKIPVNSRSPAWLTVVGLRGEKREFVKRDDLVEIIVRVFQNEGTQVDRRCAVFPA